MGLEAKMANLVRKQVMLEQWQVVALKKRARANGESESALIRRAITRELHIGRSAAPPDPEALKKIKQFVSTHKTPGETPFKFDRDSLYEDRLSKYDHDPD
jgi:hypothetical protein